MEQIKTKVMLLWPLHYIPPKLKEWKKLSKQKKNSKKEIKKRKENEKI